MDSRYMRILVLVIAVVDIVISGAEDATRVCYSSFFLVFLFFFTWLTVLFHSLPLRSTIDDGFRPRLFPVLVHASRHNGWRLRITFARCLAEAGVSACARH